MWPISYPQETLLHPLFWQILEIYNYFKTATSISFSLDGETIQFFLLLTIPDRNLPSLRSYTSSLQVILLKLLSIKLEEKVDTSIFLPIWDMQYHCKKKKLFLKLLFKIYSQPIFINICKKFKNHIMFFMITMKDHSFPW